MKPNTDYKTKATDLINAGIGDRGRLEFILECIEKDKPLYTTDKRYLIQKYETFEKKTRDVIRQEKDNRVSSFSKGLFVKEEIDYQSDQNVVLKSPIQPLTHEQTQTDYQSDQNVVSNAFEELREKIDQESEREEPKTSSTQDGKKPHRGIYDNIPQEKEVLNQDLGKLNSEEKRILTSANSYEVLEISQNASFTEIKKQWRTLSVKYNATRGALTRSVEEQKKRTEIQIKINKAWEDIRGNRK